MHSLTELTALNAPRRKVVTAPAVIPTPRYRNYPLLNRLLNDTAANEATTLSALEAGNVLSTEEIEEYAIEILGWLYEKAVAVSRIIKGEATYSSVKQFVS